MFDEASVIILSKTGKNFLKKVQYWYQKVKSKWYTVDWRHILFNGHKNGHLGSGSGRIRLLTSQIRISNSELRIRGSGSVRNIYGPGGSIQQFGTNYTLSARYMQRDWDVSIESWGGGGEGEGALSKKERNICHCFWYDGLPRNGNVGQCNAPFLSLPYARRSSALTACT